MVSQSSVRNANKLTCANITLLIAVVSASSRLLLAHSAPSETTNNYYGSYIGRLNRHSHNVSGEVYVVDEQSLFIKSFNYDGLASDAYFWSSTTSPQPASQDGFIVPDEKGSTKPLERYVNKDIVLRLPEGKTVREINWLSIWSRQTKQNLGEIMIGKSFVIPRPLEIEPLNQLAHNVRSGPITIIDAQTLLVPDFHYDGLGPAGYFWLTRGSQGLSANGLRLKDENGSANPLRKYTGESVVIVLPDELTIYDFDYFGVWCKEFQVNFGQTRIPQSSKVPPSPKMLGIKPENKLNCEILYDDLGFEIRWVLDGDDIVMQLVGKIESGEYMAFGLGKDDSRSDMNNADAVVAWVNISSGQVHAVDYFLGGKQQCINDQKGGSCPDTKLPGGGDSLTLLHGAIVNGYSMVTFKRPQLGVDELYDQHVYSDGQQSVVWAIGTLNERNEPAYHRLRTRSNTFIDFARNPYWNCPIPDHNASMHNNLPMAAASQVDSQVVMSQQQQQQQQQQYHHHHQVPPISTAETQASSPASLNDNLVSPKRQSPSNGNVLSGQTQPSRDIKPSNLVQTSGSIDRQQQLQAQLHAPHENGGGQPLRNRSVDHNDPWFIPAIVCPSDRTFYAQIGPTGAHKGYEGLTGRTSWGISWYINGLMIPELVIERGQMYRFVVEGGNVKTSSARRHPFYLTDSTEGGFDFKTDDERIKERIFAGVAIRGDEQYVPTAEGRLCEWKQTNATLANPDLYPTFSAYQRSLKLECLPGQASMLKFAPDSSTPDTIYYQCYTHRYMGWRIKVVDSCSAYLAALQARLAQGSDSAINNNAKREIKSSRSSKLATRKLKKSGAVINRRQLMGFGSTLESMKTSQSEPRITFDASNHHAFLAPPTPEFATDETVSLPSSGLDIIPNDMLILNNSQLIQRSLLNLSTIDEILKLSPSDLELIDNQPDAMLEPYIQAASGNFNTVPLPLRNFIQANNLQTNNQQQYHQQQQQQQKQVSGNKTSRAPKSLQSYLRRLASIYYPVQQQLASILASQQQAQNNSSSAPIKAALGTPTATIAATNQLLQQQQQQQPNIASTEQASTFSLSNLVPKSKIDLSKSSISKKLNKLRFKTGRKYEPNVHLMKPPTPANEFNYDIFNNQLAQLEKQQHQLQSLESLAADWPQPTESSLNYLSALASPSEEQQQQLDTLSLQQQQQQHILLGNLLRQPIFSNNNQKQLQHSADMLMAHSLRFPQQQQPFRPHPIQLSDIHFNSPNQQPQMADYLSMALNRTNNELALQHAPFVLSSHHYQQQQLSKHYEPSWMSHLNEMGLSPNADFLAPVRQQQQPSVYITRLPQQQSLSYQNPVGMDQQQLQDVSSRPPVWTSQNQPTVAHRDPSYSVRYPDIQPYSGNQQRPNVVESERSVAYRGSSQTQNQMSTMPSVPSVVQHGASSAGGQQEAAAVYTTSAVPNADSGESLSGSGSGSHYDFTQQPPIDQQQPSEARGQQQLEQSGSNSLDDHMVAMERFSKQSSERRAPSVVHPVTGEQVHLGTQMSPSASSSTIATNSASEPQATSAAQQQPRRFSSLLIDKHVVAPNGPAATFMQPSEVLDVDQTVQHAGLMQNINVSQPSQASGENFVLVSDGGPNSSAKVQRTGVFTNASLQHQQADCLNSSLDPSACQQQQQQAVVTTISSILAPPSPLLSSGPLTPSLGPLIMPTNRLTNEGETILKSTLIEPITSTLVHQPSLPLSPTNSNNNHFVSNLNFDSSPFTPIKMKNLVQYYNNSEQLQLAASNLLSSRLRPPQPLVDSINQLNQQQFRPEPPVQVASYLAQHLASHQPASSFAASSSTSEKSSRSSSSTDLSKLATTSRSSNQTQLHGDAEVGASDSNKLTASDLIILKPSILTNKQSQQQVYALKPEYMTNHFKPVADNSLLADNDFYYSSNDISEAKTKQLAVGHQFDRLSSLSSSPSTSIALHPMQAANTVTSYIKQTGSSANLNSTSSGTAQTTEQQSNQSSISSHQMSSYHDQKQYQHKANSKGGNSTTTTVSGADVSANDKLAQHRQTYTPSKSIHFEPNGSSGSSADNIRLNQGNGGDINLNALHRDNHTDNAILSHVMSLISSNAVPTPPLIPAASYSNADYFLPISDRMPRSIRG